jgi:hypothetical protein
MYKIDTQKLIDDYGGISAVRKMMRKHGYPTIRWETVSRWITRDGIPTEKLLVFAEEARRTGKHFDLCWYLVKGARAPRRTN